MAKCFLKIMHEKNKSFANNGKIKKNKDFFQ